jgi:hypothetical protein
MLLGAQRGVCTVGELKATSLGDPDRYRCSCGTLIRQCEFWKRVSTAMAARGIAAFDISHARTSIHEIDSEFARRLLQPLQRGVLMEATRDLALGLVPGWRTHLRETQRRNSALVEAVSEVAGARMVIDSSKIALRLKYLLRIAALEIKVIRLIRDGRAVSLTYTDEWRFADAADPALRGGGTGEKRTPAQPNLALAAREWRRSNESADCLTARLPRSQWMEVRYEVLCSEPRATLERLGAFLGLEPDDLTLDFRGREHHVIGNGMRFDRSSDICLDERWKSHLTAEDLQVFERLAGELNRRYGYQ